MLVCGSRVWTDQAKVEEVLERVTAGVAKVTLVQGDARGADRMAAEVARRRGWTVESHPANWRSEGRSAGMARNQRMLLSGRPTSWWRSSTSESGPPPAPGTWSVGPGRPACGASSFGPRSSTASHAAPSGSAPAGPFGA